MLNQKRLEYLLQGGGQYLEALKQALQGNRKQVERYERKLSLPYMYTDSPDKVIQLVDKVQFDCKNVLNGITIKTRQL